MTEQRYARLLVHDAPGERRAVLMDADDRPCRLFLQRWNGDGEAARLGSVHTARLRTFATSISGAFLELESGEEAFLRLKDRQGLTEGAALIVEIVSEVREGKLARAAICSEDLDSVDAWSRWRSQIAGGEDLAPETDPDGVAAAFDEALSPSITLPGGGQLHIDRTRALTAFDVDTSGRVGKGSAGARALSANKDAVCAMARQVSLRGLGGNLVLDCISPLNKAANEALKSTGEAAFASYGLGGARVLRPSPLGLMEVGVPWRFTPIEDRLAANQGERELLHLFRTVQREAAASPTALFELSLSKSALAAYLNRKQDADAELKRFFGGRVTILTTESDASGVRKR